MKWRAKVDINPILQQYHDEELSFEEVRDKVVEVIENNPIFASFPQRGDFRQTEDVESFDDVLEKLYDYADIERIWLGF